MIKQLFSKLRKDKLRKKPLAVQAARRVIPAQQHDLHHEEISDAALKTISILREKGFEAYLVGGGVRDLLLDMHPKDFDVATNATPEQVVRLFRNAMIIGRRFKIVHVRYGRDMIEVTTFRGHHHDNTHKKTAHSNDSGMLLRDNVYGSMEEDALRRDFTVNALYYDIDKRSVIDYTHGIEDLNKQQINMIGDPEQRYREDPVRMLRAVRLAAKLNFSIEENTAAHIIPLRELLKDIASARMFDEILKLFTAGYALDTFLLLQKYQLFYSLFPHTAHLLQKNPGQQRFVELAMKNTDYRINNNKRTSPSYLFAVFLWPAFQEELERQLSQANPPPAYQAQHIAADKVIGDLVQRVSIPRRFSAPMKEIWQLQFRLDNRRGKRAQGLFEHQRFRAAYDFVLLREETGEDLNGLGQWWTDYQDADEMTRQHMADKVSTPDHAHKKRPRRGGRSNNK